MGRADVSKEHRTVGMKLSKWQKKFILDEFDAPLRIACTGIGAGKSRALAVWIVLQCLKKPGIRGIVIAQIYKTLTRVLVREIQVVCALLGVEYDYNKSSMEMVFPNQSTLFFYSAENATGILGLSEVSLLAIDESAYAPREVYDFAHDRMRGGKYPPMVRLISSPVNDELENWFKELVEKYEILPLQVGYDRYNAQYLTQEMAAYGFHMDDVFQGFNLSPVIMEMEGLMKDGTIDIGDNDLLKVHLLDSALKQNTESKSKLVKLNQNAHIDGTAALLDAMTVRMKHYADIGEQLKN